MDKTIDRLHMVRGIASGQIDVTQLDIRELKYEHYYWHVRYYEVYTPDEEQLITTAVRALEKELIRRSAVTILDD